MDWTNFFAPHILERGYDYFIDCAVEDVTIKDHLISAIVTGSTDYIVKIHLIAQEIIDMTCTCPYAKDDNYCKHMAAVLYEVHADEVDDGDNVEENYEDHDYLEMHSQNTENRYIQNLVESTNESIVKAFLVSVLENQPKLLLRFKNTVAPDTHTFNRSDYLRRIKTIVDVHMGREHFISYYKANDFIDDIQEFLNEDVRLFITNNHLNSAFELSTLIFQMIGTVEMDDSDGGTSLIASQCFDVWQEILSKADLLVKQTIFDWCISHLDGNAIDFLADYIETCLMESFHEKIFIDELLAFTEQKAIEAEAQSESWSRSYNVGKWATNHLSLLIRSLKTEKEIENYALKYFGYSSLRNVYIRYYLQQNNYEKVISILNESIQIDAGSIGLIRDYRLQLRDVYKKLGDLENYLEQLWQLILVDWKGDLSIFKELKSQYSASDWLKKREIIFNKIENKSELAQLYFEEKLYDQLLNVVINSNGLSLTQHFEKVLIKKYPAAILDKYKQEVTIMAQPTTDRKKYHQIVSLLKDMKKIQGGPEVVSEIARSWRFTYGNRPAMMDELRRL